MIGGGHTSDLGDLASLEFSTPKRGRQYLCHIANHACDFAKVVTREVPPANMHAPLRDQTLTSLKPPDRSRYGSEGWKSCRCRCRGTKRGVQALRAQVAREQGSNIGLTRGSVG